MTQATLSPPRRRKRNFGESADDSMNTDSNRGLRMGTLEKFVESDRPRRLAVASATFEEYKQRNRNPTDTTDSNECHQ
jgi:hypothetical protein